MKENCIHVMTPLELISDKPQHKHVKVHLHSCQPIHINSRSSCNQ